MSDNSPDDVNALLQEFRTLTMLLILVSSLNKGHSTIPSRGNEEYMSALDPSQSYRTKALNAIPSVLVRSTEVIAAAALEPQKNFSSNSGEDDSIKYHVLAIHEVDDGESAGGARLIERFMAIANPPKPQPRVKETVWDLRPSPPGKSEWASVDVSPWFYLEQKNIKKAPLQNHMATIEEYLRVYYESSESKRDEVFIKVSRYLIASCWRKMFDRIKHWSSLGLLYSFSRIPQDAVIYCYDHYNSTIPPSQRKDTLLGRALMDLTDNQLNRILLSYPSQLPHEPVHRIDNLLAQFRKSPEEGTGTPYNRETCVEFHYFVICVLVAYGQSLADLRNANKAQQDDLGMEAVIDRAKAVWHYAYLLWRISYSEMLRKHLHILSSDGHLETVPTASRQFIYRNAFTFGNISADTPADVDEDIPVVDPEVELQSLAQSVSKQSRFLKWIRLNVSHFAAMDILSTFIAFKSQSQAGLPLTLKMTLLDSHTSDRTMMDWKDLVRKLFPPDLYLPEADNALPDAIIGLILRLINENASQYRIAQMFQENPVKFPGTVHCEAALAASSRYPELVSKIGNEKEQEDLAHFATHMNEGVIAVSRLCCPVCWDLLSIMRGDTGNLAVRGHHSTIFPVDLPRWLPVDVIRAMVLKYQRYTIAEIKNALAKAVSNSVSSKHNRAPSFQSDGGHSVDSNESGQHHGTSETYKT